MPQRDIQSELSFKDVDTISIVAASAPYEVAGTAIDTKGARAIVFGVRPDEAIGTDVLALKIYESDTSGGTYTEIASNKYLDNGSKAIGDADSGGFIVSVGAFSTKRFIKPYVDADTVADDLTVSVLPVLKFENRPNDVTTVDTLP